MGSELKCLLFEPPMYQTIKWYTFWVLVFKWPDPICYTNKKPVYWATRLISTIQNLDQYGIWIPTKLHFTRRLNFIYVQNDLAYCYLVKFSTQSDVSSSRLQQIFDSTKMKVADYSTQIGTVLSWKQNLEVWTIYNANAVIIWIQDWPSFQI